MVSGGEEQQAELGSSGTETLQLPLADEPGLQLSPGRGAGAEVGVDREAHRRPAGPEEALRGEGWVVTHGG